MALLVKGVTYQVTIYERVLGLQEEILLQILRNLYRRRCTFQATSRKRSSA